MDRREKIKYNQEELNKYVQFINDALDEIRMWLDKVIAHAHDAGFYTGVSDEEYEDGDESEDESE